MDAFGIREKLIAGYRSFTEGFVDIQDPRIKDAVVELGDKGRQWPDPWLSLNPSFSSGGRIDELVQRGLLHPDCDAIFRPKKDSGDRGSAPITLHKHQRDAIEIAAKKDSYVLTTGTGSGKSLAYIIPIVDRVLREGSGKGVKAIIVYPMNALANSQMEELSKFLDNGFDGKPPVTFARYTGQERGETRENILKNPPDILLTNYVMLEYVLTRPEERQSLIRAASGLQFLVLDELHTYRGRQGADVAMLVRRLRDACNAQNTLQCIGTSATMSSGGTVAQQQKDVAHVASRIFGTAVSSDHVVTETLVQATTNQHRSDQDLKAAVRERGDAEYSSPTLAGGYALMASDPLASWIEDTFGLTKEPESGKIIRRQPQTVTQAAEELSKRTGESATRCATAIRATLLAGSRAKHAETDRPLFAFRLHQFVSKAGSLYATAESEDIRLIETDFQLTVGDAEKRLYPLAFCRECGQEYLMARLTEAGGEFRFIARHELKMQDTGGPDNGQDGYLYISTEQEWPEHAIEAGRIPSSWLNESASGHRIIDSKRNRIPLRYRVNPDGAAARDNEYPQHLGQLAAWVPGSLGFCLNCQVTYESARSGEFSKVVSSTSLNFFIVKQFPVLPPEVLRGVTKWNDPSQSFVDWIRPRVAELEYTTYEAVPDAAAGLERGGPFQWNPERRSRIRAELDAALFVEYGYDRATIDYVLDSFPIVMRKDLSRFGEYRTKRLILEAYDAMHEAIKTGIRFESTLNPPPGQGPRHPVKELSA